MLAGQSGPGFIGLSVYVVRAQHLARAYGLGPKSVSALFFGALCRALVTQGSDFFTFIPTADIPVWMFLLLP